MSNLFILGAKITVDSATMMNKGLEVIEAHYLFGSSYDNIDIVVHPQSIIHSAVEAADSSVIAQLGWPDMRLPLLYSIAWPARVNMPWRPLDLAEIGTLTFKKPDYEKYPCIPLAYAAGRKGQITSRFTKNYLNSLSLVHKLRRKDLLLR